MLKVVCTKVVFMTTEDMVKGGKFLGEFKCTCSYFHTLSHAQQWRPIRW